jgi:hypothetical protein
MGAAVSRGPTRIERIKRLREVLPLDLGDAVKIVDAELDAAVQLAVTRIGITPAPNVEAEYRGYRSAILDVFAGGDQ